jgi:hypothetical protein
MTNYCFDDTVKATIAQEADMLIGAENKEDAIQEAYLAILDECPITVVDACACAKRAIIRQRNRVRKIYKHEIQYREIDYDQEIGDQITGIDERTGLYTTKGEPRRQWA